MSKTEFTEEQKRQFRKLFTEFLRRRYGPITSRKEFKSFLKYVVEAIGADDLPSDIYRGDYGRYSTDQWEPVHGSDPWPRLRSAEDVELLDVFGPEESYLLAEVARKRAARRVGKRELLGFSDAVLLMAELHGSNLAYSQQTRDFIKSVPRGARAIFPGTLFRASNSRRLFVPCLYHHRDGEHWDLSSIWLGDGLDHTDRIVCMKHT